MKIQLVLEIAALLAILLWAARRKPTVSLAVALESAQNDELKIVQTNPAGYDFQLRNERLSVFYKSTKEARGRTETVYLVVSGYSSGIVATFKNFNLIAYQRNEMAIDPAIMGTDEQSAGLKLLEEIRNLVGPLQAA